MHDVVGTLQNVGLLARSGKLKLHKNSCFPKYQLDLIRYQKPTTLNVED